MTATRQRLGFHSHCLGDIEWDAESELCFSQGIPGFEHLTRFVPFEIPAQWPLVYLQSATEPWVCFFALPVQSVAPDLDIQLTADDYLTLGLDPAHPPVPGLDILCLTVLGPSDTGIRTNVACPVVINLHNRRGLQIVTDGSSNYWRLGDSGTWEAVCSW